MNTGIREWYDEQKASAYPLSRSIGHDNVLLDASFVTFDGFIPVLTALQVEADTVEFTLQIEDQSVTVDFEFPLGSTEIQEKELILSNGRKVGVLVFAVEGLNLLKNSKLGIFELNIPFDASTVRSVNSNAGLYSIDNQYGDVAITTRTDTGLLIDRTVFIDLNEEGTWTWSAAALPEGGLTSPALKTLNSVVGSDNFNVNLRTSPELKIVAGESQLLFELAAVNLDRVAPVLKYGA